LIEIDANDLFCAGFFQILDGAVAGLNCLLWIRFIEVTRGCFGVVGTDLTGVKNAALRLVCRELFAAAVLEDHRRSEYAHGGNKKYELHFFGKIEHGSPSMR
jgi:hypothetical protein